MVNYYEILGVTADATPEAIQAAYRAKASAWHPDRNNHDPELAEKLFKLLQEAYEVLGDAKRRQEYDSKLQDASAPEIQWCKVETDVDFGGLKLHTDGSLSVGTQHVPAGLPLSKVECGAFILDRGDHTGGDLLIKTRSKTIRLRYVDHGWYQALAVGSEVPPPNPNRRADKSRQGNSPKATSATSSVAAKSSAAQLRPSAAAGRSTGRVTKSVSVFAAIVVLCLAGGLFFGRKLLDRAEATTSSTSAELDEADANQSQLDETDYEKKRQQQADEERRSVALAALESADRIARRVGTLLDECAAADADWQQLQIAILTNEEGRRLASQENLVRNFMQLRKDNPAVADDIAGLRRDLELLSAPLQKALTNQETPVAPSATTTDRLQQLKQEVESLRMKLRAPRLAVDSMLRSVAPGTTGKKSLQDAIDDIQAAAAADRAARTAVVQMEAERKDAEQAERMAREKRDTARAAEAAQADAENRAAEQKIQHDKDLVEANSEAVQDRLAFFFTPGYLQPTADGVEMTTEKKPMSLSRLKVAGALDDSTDGLQKLYIIVCNRQEKDRDTWGLEDDINFIEHEKLEKLRQAQIYLRRLGGVLVEMKLLSP